MRSKRREANPRRELAGHHVHEKLRREQVTESLAGRTRKERRRRRRIIIIRRRQEAKKSDTVTRQPTQNINVQRNPDDPEII